MDERARADLIAVSAAHALGCIRSDQWHLVAALLLDDGLDCDPLVALASLTSRASGWEVDALVPDTLRELDAPRMDVDTAGDVIASLLAAGLAREGHQVVRRLAGMAPGLDYPGGAIGRAYALEEWLDCECHEGSPERAEADAFEAALRAQRSRVRPELVNAIVGA